MATPNPRQAETFQQAIPRLNLENISAFNHGDIVACAGVYAEDATLLLPDRPVIKNRKVIDALALRPGDIVVEIGYGTGLNYALLELAIGSDRRIIGVDISDAMLERAKINVRKAGWENVEFVCCAAADYQFPENLGGILQPACSTTSRNMIR